MRHASFADELRAREDEALRLAELGAPVAIERLEKLEKLKFLGSLKCDMESEAARAIVAKQDARIDRLTEELKSQRVQSSS